MAIALGWAAFAGQSGFGQGTAFSYQGQLLNNGQSANGTYDITFTLFASNQYGFPVGPVLTNLGTPVSQGLFFATLNFGAVFSGSNYWVEIAVRTNGNGNFTILEPRQAVTSAPYAIFAGSASNALVAQSAASVAAGGIIGTIPVSSLSTNVPLLTSNGTLPASVLPTNSTSLAGLSWQSPSSTTVQAQAGVAYLLTNSQQTTITLPVAPNVGDVFEVVGASSGGWVLAQGPGQTIAASFVPLVLPGDIVGFWSSVASSGDGTKLAAAIGTAGSDQTGRIWISGNSGSNWTQAAAPNQAWPSITSSTDGSRLVASATGVGGTVGGGIWTSTNFGSNWEQTLAPITNWSSIVSSSNGTSVKAVVSGGGIWTSADAGKTWAQSDAPNLYWVSVASSADGVRAAATAAAEISVGATGGDIWVSTNSGSNWQQTSAVSTSWDSITSSADGTKLAAVVYNGGIWTSSNSGTTWVQSSAPVTYWSAIASSADGTRLAATVAGGEPAIWTSTV